MILRDDRRTGFEPSIDVVVWKRVNLPVGGCLDGLAEGSVVLVGAPLVTDVAIVSAFRPIVPVGALDAFCFTYFEIPYNHLCFLVAVDSRKIAPSLPGRRFAIELRGGVVGLTFKPRQKGTLVNQYAPTNFLDAVQEIGIDAALRRVDTVAKGLWRWPRMVVIEFC